MVGHLGTLPLAGLALASTLLSTLVGLCVFLAYATTAATGTLVGAGVFKEKLSALNIAGVLLALAAVGCLGRRLKSILWLCRPMSCLC